MYSVYIKKRSVTSKEKPYRTYQVTLLTRQWFVHEHMIKQRMFTHFVLYRTCLSFEKVLISLNLGFGEDKILNTNRLGYFISCCFVWCPKLSATLSEGRKNLFFYRTLITEQLRNIILSLPICSLLRLRNEDEEHFTCSTFQVSKGLYSSESELEPSSNTSLCEHFTALRARKRNDLITKQGGFCLVKGLVPIIYHLYFYSGRSGYLQVEC